MGEECRSKNKKSESKIINLAHLTHSSSLALVDQLSLVGLLFAYVEYAYMCKCYVAQCSCTRLTA